MKQHRIISAALLALVLPALQGRAENLWTTVEYGASTPTLSCTPLSACLVTLQAGETVRNSFLADSSGWELETGTVSDSVPVLAIKPHRCSTSTNLFVTTSFRAYAFVLDSPPCDPGSLKTDTAPHMLRFTYPAQFAKAWGAPPPIIPSPGLATQASSLENLNFDYTIASGRNAIEPQRVFDDGQRTFITLRPEDLHAEAPAVFVFTPDGKLEAVNFIPPSPGNRTYIVDRVAPRLVLVSGPKNNQRCILTRKGAR
jgi:P-type conjugative transfer protein TrbG